MSTESDYYTHGEDTLRAAIDDIAGQLSVAVDGVFDFTVKAPVADETLDKLAMLINFVIEAARRSVSDLREKNVHLAEVDRLKSLFLANVSHELRTPLALILGPTERWLDSGALTGEQARDLGVVMRNARSLLRTVNELLDLSKAEAGRLAPAYARTDLGALVRTTGSLFDAIAREHRVVYEVSAPESLSAEVDPEMIGRVLQNLLSNAFKLGPPGGRIACSLEACGDEVVLAVQDTGPGIPREMRERIFERFVQLEDGSARRQGGTGIGLALARELVGLHRGTIEVVDPPGGGARFVVTLPRRAPEGTPMAAEEPASAPRPADLDAPVAEEPPDTALAPLSAPGPERGVVLVVEDNPEMRRFLVETLRDEYRVLSAEDGRQGLERARAHGPDLILSDVMMPRMSGDEMVAELRRLPELATVPIVLLTAKADDPLRVRLLQEGVDDYLTKPCSAVEVRARIRNLVTAKRARDLLQREVRSSRADLEELVHEVSLRRHELESALDAARASRAEVERLLRLRDEFISIAAHELKTPLTPLNLQRQMVQRLMARSDVPEPVRERKLLAYFDVSCRQIQALTSLVDTLLDLSRLRLGSFTLDAVPGVDLAATVGEVVERYRPLWEAARSPVQISTRGAPTGCWDRVRLEQVAANLLGNAVKHGAGRPIEIEVSGFEGGARFSVRDHGPGIGPEDQARIFNRFERAASIKTFGGLGLGLYIARRIVDAHGGSLRVESALGRGSKFIVELPASAPAA